MKKMTMLWLIAVFVFSSLAYAQNKISQAESPETKAKIEALLSSAERWQRWSPMQANRSIQDVGLLMRKPDVSPETRRDATKRLVKIFYSIDDSGTNRANKKRILEAIGFSDNSPEAHDFFLKILSSGDKEYREMALWSIRPLGVHGDDLYEKIKALGASNTLSRVDTLMYLKLANPERALPEIQEFLRTTQDLEDFVIVGGNLSTAYQDPNVMDVVIERYGYFKTKSVSQKHPASPVSGAIYSEMLWKYLDIKEGGKVKKGMEILKDKGVAGNRDLARLQKKLGSSDVITREAVIDFIAGQIEDKEVDSEKAAPILSEARSRESIKKLQTKLKDIMERRDKERKAER